MSGTITAAEINTPLVGGTVFTNNELPEGQAETESFTGDTIALAAITPSVTGGSANPELDGPGGDATLTFANDVIEPGIGLGVMLTASTVGGAGGNAGTGPDGPLPGKPGGAATTAISTITATAAAPTTLTLMAAGGSSAIGAGGAGATTSLSGSTIEVTGASAGDALEIELDATGSEGGSGFTTQDAGFGGAGGGPASDTVSRNTIAAASITLSLNAIAGIGGEIYSPYTQAGYPHPAGSGPATVSMTDNQVSVTGTSGTLDLSLGNGVITFSGNSLQGGGASLLVLSSAFDGYAIDTAASTITVGGSGSNTLTGFTTFDVSQVAAGDNTFTVGSANQEIELGDGFTTVTVKPESGDLTITGATQSNLVLDFEGLGPGLTTLTQLLADVSTPTANTEIISLPNGGTITLEGTPISFNRLNVVLPTNAALPPPPPSNLPASAINTPVVGASGDTTDGGQNGQSAMAVFDRDVFTQTNLSPSVTGGNGMAFVGTVNLGFNQNFLGAGGAASLELQNDIMGAGGDGAITLNANAAGGQGPTGPEVSTFNGGNGGNATACCLDENNCEANMDNAVLRGVRCSDRSHPLFHRVGSPARPGGSSGGQTSCYLCAPTSAAGAGRPGVRPRRVSRRPLTATLSTARGFETSLFPRDGQMTAKATGRRHARAHLENSHPKAPLQAAPHPGNRQAQAESMRGDRLLRCGGLLVKRHTA